MTVNFIQLAPRVVSNPQILNGKPCVQGTRIPVTAVLQLLSDGLTYQQIIADYYPHLKPKDIQACIEYARHLVDNDELMLAAA
jgi:uncharacterized protein (DUF433 family)